MHLYVLKKQCQTDHRVLNCTVVNEPRPSKERESHPVQPHQPLFWRIGASYSHTDSPSFPLLLSIPPQISLIHIAFSYIRLDYNNTHESLKTERHKNCVWLELLQRFRSCLFSISVPLHVCRTCYAVQQEINRTVRLHYCYINSLPSSRPWSEPPYAKFKWPHIYP